MERFKSELLDEIVKSKKLEGSEELINSQVYNYFSFLTRERFDIKTDKQSKYYGKAIGRYDLFAISNPLELSRGSRCKIKKEMSKVLCEFLGTVTRNSKMLIVGLGNRHISADSLGTKVIAKINVGSGKNGYVMAMCPSVMGLTGIETYDIISGVVDNVKPTHLILIDSLCASSVDRLCKSIQISNTGICPGSGIGNKRKCIDKSLAENVISIGVPLLIYSSTFVEEKLSQFDINVPRLDSIMQSLKNHQNIDGFVNFCNNLREMLNSTSEDMIVTIKDIEECVDVVSDLIASAINILLGVDFE